MLTLAVPLLALLLGSCGAHAPSHRFLSEPIPSGQVICITSVPSAGQLPGKQRAAWTAEYERADGAEFTVETLSHPAWGSLQVANDIRAGKPGTAGDVIELARDNPDDFCLQYMAGLGGMMADDKGTWRRHSEAAYSLASDTLPVAKLYLGNLLAQEDAEVALALAVALRETFPEDLEIAGLTFKALWDSGQKTEAVPHYEAALALGAPHDPAEALQIYGQAGALGPYLAMAAKMGAWLPDGVVEATDSWTAYRSAFGIPDEGRLTVQIETTHGTLSCDLLHDEAPVTVANFVGLATGMRPWGPTDATTPLYPGTTFHRVIPSFMIQGGDPAGDGTGGPGYAFMDEFLAPRGFDEPALLAMANSGPGTNGSQFFITEAPTPHLSGKHTIFGQCDPGTLEVVAAIARVAADSLNRPLDPVVIEAIRFEGGTVDLSPPPKPEPEPEP